MENWKILIRDTGYKITREIYITRKNGSRTEFLEPDGKITSYEYGAAINPKPIVELEPEMLQALSDELSKIGYKPLKGYLEGKLEATENHLKDVRTLLKLK